MIDISVLLSYINLNNESIISYMRNLAKYFFRMAFVAMLSVVTYSCSDDDNNAVADDFKVQFTVPQSADLFRGGDLYFSVVDGEAPLVSDAIMLESSGGVFYNCTISGVSESSFAVSVPADIESGTYRAYLKRGDRRKLYGTVAIKVIEGAVITPDEGTTVYGQVICAGAGVKDVVVSDGVEVTVTDADGIYQLESAKRTGYVFISVPGGYEVPSDGVLPRFAMHLRAAADTPERVDFTLNEAFGQDTYKVFFLGDMHLANRTKDLEQFKDFTDDLNKYMAAHSGEKMYAVTLGDMTWDLYWYSNKYELADYLKTVNEAFKDLQIFHTMGNHDNDMNATSDFDAEIRYRTVIAPTYYSFNIGKVHYVVLDDIDCSSYDGTDSRNYSKKISDEQFAWLEKDLSHVAKTTPLVVTMHAQVFKPGGATSYVIDHDVTNTNRLFDILAGYKVHFVTGHTHQIYNVTPENSNSGTSLDFFEHNAGAICASWWWSGNLTPGMHIATDGAPGGYAVWDVNGTDMKYIYKGTGYGENVQFRSFDLNKVYFNDESVKGISTDSKVQAAWKKYADAYPASSKNEVLVNVWNWNPSWTITVTTENGKALDAVPVQAYDPLHIAAYTAPRFAKGSNSVPGFITEMHPHFFKIAAPDADTDLKITVKDEFGNTWTENMARPKDFSIEAYMPK